MTNERTVIRGLMYANACLLSAGEPGCPDLATAQRRSISAMNHATEFLAGHPTPEHCNGQSRIQQLEEQVEVREYARKDAERRAQAAEEDAKEYGDALKIAAQRLIKVEAELEHLKAQKNTQLEKLESALERIRDCDWMITLPDRMDAVRTIAREALQ